MNVIQSCLNSIPRHLDHLLIVHLIEDSIRPDDDEVKLICDLKSMNLRGCDDNPFLSSKSWVFGINITKAPADTQPPWQDSSRPIHFNRFQTFWINTCIADVLVNLASC